MKVIEPQFYKLIIDGNFLDDHPEIIAYEQRNDHGFNDLLMGKGIHLSTHGRKILLCIFVGRNL